MNAQDFVMAHNQMKGEKFKLWRWAKDLVERWVNGRAYANHETWHALRNIATQFDWYTTEPRGNIFTVLERIATALETLSSRDAPIQRKEDLQYDRLQVVGYSVVPFYVCDRCRQIVSENLTEHAKRCTL